MPTPCNNCNKTFDLTDGVGYNNIVYCKECGNNLNRIDEIDIEITDLELEIEDAKYTVDQNPILIEILEKEKQTIIN